MIIELTNFRNHKYRKITLPDVGLFILLGKSGIGKSSIMMAFYFVISGKGHKLISHNEKKMKVYFEFRNMKITRTKSPNTLILLVDNKEYQDEVAQKYIDNIFGFDFAISSYITQKSINSFISMTPVDKLKFLERVSLQDYDVNSLKSKLKNKIKEMKLKYENINGQIKVYREQLSQMKRPIEVKCPIKNCNNNTQFNSKYNKVLRDIIIFNYTIQENKKKLSIFEEATKENIKKNVLKNEIEKQKIELENENNKTRDEKDKIIYIGDDKLNVLLNTMTKYTKIKELDITINNSKKLLEEYKNKYTILNNDLKELDFLGVSYLEKLKSIKKYHEIKNNIDKIKYEKNIYIENSKIQEQKKELEKMKLDISDFKYTDKDIKNKTYELKQREKYEEENIEITKIKNKINNITTDFSCIDKIKEEIDRYKKKKMLLSQHPQRCPHCKTLLKILEEKLQIVEDESILDDTTIKDIDTTIIKQEKELKIILTSQKSFENLKYQETEKQKIINLLSKTVSNKTKKELENELNYINKSVYENNIKRENIKSYETKLKKIEQAFNEKMYDYDVKLNKTMEEIKKYTTDIIDNIVEEDTDKKLQEQQSKYQKYTYIKEQIDEIENHINKLKNTISEQNQEQKEIENSIDKNLNISPDYIEEQKSNKQLLKILNKRLDELSDKINLTNIEFKKYENIEEEIIRNKTDMNNLMKDTKQIEDKLNKYIMIKEKGIKYLMFLSDNEKYNNHISGMSKLLDIEETTRKKISGFEKFIDKIQESEAKILSTTIDNINYRMSDYLNKFFDDPISVNIVQYKETKNDIKHSININVNYKGNDIDITALSGGELDRVILSFVLSLNSTINSPILLLDESLSSLDENTCNNILNNLKDEKKFIMIVSHQAQTGIFDKTINIENT